MSKRKKYTIIATQPTIYEGEFYALSKAQALNLAEKSHHKEWKLIAKKEWQYKISENSEKLTNKNEWDEYFDYTSRWK
tara:strand:+ start:39 stop:272 length:234 start_codon:yes stop_codon:yes gene_type:complete